MPAGPGSVARVRTTKIALSLVVGLIVLPGRPVTPAPPEAPPTEWRQAQHDAARSGFYPEAIRPPLRIAWQTALPDAVDTVVGAGDTLYTVGSWSLHALHAADGRKLWSQQRVGSVLPASPIALDNGLIHWRFSQERFSPMLERMAQADGRTVWEREITEGTPTDLIRTRDGSLLASLHGSSTTDGRLLRIDVETGKLLAQHSTPVSWFAMDARARKSWRGFWPYRIAEPPGQDWFLLQSPSLLATVNPSFKAPPRVAVFDPAFERETDSWGEGYAITDGNRLYRTNYSAKEGFLVEALDSRGKPVWRTLIPEARRVAAIAPAYVLLADGGHFGVLEPATGRKLWLQNAAPNRRGEITCVTGDVLWVSAIAAGSQSQYPDSVEGYSLADGKALGAVKLLSNNLTRVSGMIAHRGALYVLHREILGKGPTTITRLAAE